MKKIVLIMPARNEAAHIEKTIQAVVRQTLLPIKWVIVSDGSTDGTDEIVSGYLSKHPFMELVRAGNEKNRNFGSKVSAFYAGFERVCNLDYDFIGNLDADISFDRDYFERLVARFDEVKLLGIGGGWVCEPNEEGVFEGRRDNRTRTVPGAVQMFRRKCFEDSGGYLRIPVGGEDTVIEIAARMHGWRVEAFRDLCVKHYRKTGSAGNTNFLQSALQCGRRDFIIGYHPLYEVSKNVSRFAKRPYVVGGMLNSAGFFMCYFNGEKCAVPRDIVRHLRKEQLAILNPFKKL